jgi:probable phosphoglycerate mutase
MFRILLVQPGTTEFDQQGRVQGTLDIPLCEDGRREVESMLEELRGQPIEAVYTSPSEAAEQTAEALASMLELRPRPIDNLKNLDHGLWQGMLISDVKAKQPKVYRQWQEQPANVCPPQGETIGAVKERIQTSVAKLMKKHKSEGLVAVVVPEPLASVMRQVLRNDELGDLWEAQNGPARWAILDVAPATVGT